MPLYHYTDRVSADAIKQQGVIRAASIILHRDMFGLDEGLKTPPIVWLTTNSVSEPTVAVKLQQADLVQFIIPADITVLTLDQFAKHAGISRDWFAWMIFTGHLAGSDSRDWRIATSDIPIV